MFARPRLMLAGGLDNGLDFWTTALGVGCGDVIGGGLGFLPGRLVLAGGLFCVRALHRMVLW